MLPHLDQKDDRPLAELVSAIEADGSSESYYLAVSNGFWELDEQEAFNVIFDAYHQFFMDLVDQISQLIGSPSFQGRWDSPEFPEWGHGHEIAVWSDRLWLRLEHEDKECPILIALSSTPNSPAKAGSH